MIRRRKGKYYDSIRNCPLIVWQEVKDTEKLDPILIEGRFDFEKASEAWRKIMGEFVEEFGISEVYKQYLRMMASAMLELVTSYKEGEKWRRPVAQIDIAVAKSYIDGPAPKLSQVIAQVSKNMGFRVDPQTVTVAEFFGYVNAK